ncbi:MAG: hypothetical protein II942_01765, partial [Alphaproteobacteria bacterium]|nr:hypothetical protein [Alphaproteobacteria bacterium]
KKKVWWLSDPRISIGLTRSLRGVAGMTDITFNKVELSCFAADGRNMVRDPSLSGDIAMAATLGHELRHIMTRYAYLSLMMYAQTKSEVLLAKLLQEEDAWFMGDRIESELYVNSDFLPVPDRLKERNRKYDGENGRLQHMKDTLNGTFAWAGHEAKDAYRSQSHFRSEPNPVRTRLFNELVGVWLTNMKLPISVEEVLQSPILQIAEEKPAPRLNWFQRLFGRGQNVR